MRLMADSSSFFPLPVRDVKRVHGDIHFGSDAGKLNIHVGLAQGA